MNQTNECPHCGGLRRELDDEREKVLLERWAAHHREHLVHQDAHDREHIEYRDRIETATVVLDRRLDQMNEFRAQLTEERALYVRRDMLDEFRIASAKVTDANAARIRELETAKSNLEGRLWAVGMGIGALVIVINVVIAVFV